MMFFLHYFIALSVAYWNKQCLGTSFLGTAQAFVSPISSTVRRGANNRNESFENGYGKLQVAMVNSQSDESNIQRDRNQGRGRIQGRNIRTNERARHGNKSTYKMSKKKGKNYKNSKQLMEAKAINKEVINSESAQDVLEIFMAKGGAKGAAGGGVFNSVNYSTLLHRLARFATYIDYTQNRNNPANSVDQKRKVILSDPRTAILLASLAEALVQPKSNKMLVFNNRELANLGWAIAKLKIAPPSNVYPIVRPIDSNEMETNSQNKHVIHATMEDIENDLLDLARKVRLQVLEVAKERSSISDPAERALVKSKWIPMLSALSGKLLDVIAAKVLEILDNFNSQELANLLYANANAGRADEYLFGKLSDQLVYNMKKVADLSPVGNSRGLTLPKPQEFSNSVWAFASAGVRCQGQVNLIQCVAETLDRNDGEIVKEFKPQELSNTAWGVATLISKRGSETEDDDNTVEDQSALRILRWVAKSLNGRVNDFKPQEISNSVWAFATLGFGATTSANQLNTNNDYISLPSNQLDQDRELVAQSLQTIAINASSRLHRFRPQELNNLAWGFCRLGHHSDDMRLLFEGIGQQIVQRHYQFAPQDIGTTLWSFATVEYFDESVYKAAASELTLRKSRSFKPQELSNTVWALATAGATPQTQAFDTTLVKQSQRSYNDPITECFAAATTELIRRPNEFKEQEIKDVLWSLSKAGIRHPRAFKRVAEYLVGSTTESENVRGLNGFSPQGLGNLAWSYARQGQLAGGIEESVIGSTGRLAVYETISLDVGEDLIQRLFTRIGETIVLCGAARFKPQDLSNTCWAFATLGLLHKDFFGTVAKVVNERLKSFNPSNKSDTSLVKFKAQEIANLVWSFATLNYKGGDLLHSFTPYIIYLCSDGKKSTEYDVKTISQSFKRQEVASIAWSCAVLEQYPPQLMTLLYTALFGSSDRTTPQSLKDIYSDDGIQTQAVMTMFYVQMALDIEAPELALSLPSTFPDDWKESNDSVITIDSIQDEDDTSMLHLTTSRLQQNVSRALQRIGFNHVQEHIISTTELQEGHGIYLSPEHLEFLSIDIADTSKLIGIEVDGPGHFVTVLDSDSKNVCDDTKGSAMRTGKGKTGWKFTANSEQQMNGPTALKGRLLRHMGWSIVHIPYWKWRDLKGNEEAEEDYTKRLLEGIQSKP